MTALSTLIFTGDRAPRAFTRRRRMILREPAENEGGIFVPKIMSKPVQPGYGFKFAIFAGLHGDEEAGTLAAFDLVRWASEQPVALADYELHLYPVCNPSGRRANTRHSRNGRDLNREFWNGSAEPEVRYLEGELRREKYDGIISLHSDDTSDGCYGFVSGSLLSQHLLEPALRSAETVLPRNPSPVIDGFLATHGIITDGYPGVLSAPPEQRPRALEIVFETPALAPMNDQVKATVLAVRSILAGYRQLQAFAPNL